MKNYSIVHLAPNDWYLYKEIRLESLKTDSQAFSSSFEKEVLYKEEHWRSRLDAYSDKSKQFHSFLKNNKTNKIVGVVGAYSPEEGKAVVVNVFVSPKHRGNGLGLLMMKDILSQIQNEKTFKVIELSVNKDQKEAIKLYKKSGFKIIKQKKKILGDDKEHIGYVMRKLL